MKGLTLLLPEAATPDEVEQYRKTLRGEVPTRAGYEVGVLEREIPLEAGTDEPDTARALPFDASDPQRRLHALVASAQTPYVCIASPQQRVDLAVASRMVELLEESGLAFATGAIKNSSDRGDEVAPEFLESHATTQQLIDVTDPCPFFHDLDVHNKVYSREFLLRTLESVELSLADWSPSLGLAALCSAGFICLESKALVTRPCPTESAELRRRNSSLDELRGRRHHVLTILEDIEKLNRPELQKPWRLYALGQVYGELYPLVPRVDEDYWAELQSATAEASEGLAVPDVAPLNLHARILAYLTTTDRRADVEAVSYFRSDHGSSVVFAASDDQLTARPHYLSHLTADLPHELFTADPGDLAVNARLLSYGWDEHGDLQLGGWAYIPGVDLADATVRTRVVLVEERTEKSIAIATEPYEEPRADLASNDRFLSYARAGFRASIPRAALESVDADSDESPEWLVQLEITWDGGTVTGPYTTRDTAGQAGHLKHDRLRNGSRYVALFTKGEGLRLKRSKPKYVVEEISLAERRLALTVVTDTGLVADHLTITNTAAKITRQAELVELEQGRARYEADIPSIPQAAKAITESEWEVRAPTGLYGRQALAWPGTDDELQHLSSSRLWVETSGFGYLRVRERRWRIVANTVTVSSDGAHLLVEGTCDFETYHPLRIALVSGRHVVYGETTVQLSNEGSTPGFQARIPLCGAEWGQEATALEAGGYSLRYITPRGTVAKSHWILFNRHHTTNLPSLMKFDGGTVEVSRTVRNAAVKIDIRPPLTEYERSAYGRHQLQQQYFGPESSVDDEQPPLENHVLVQCYGGRKVTDAPLQISERLRQDFPDVPVYWGTEDHSTPVPSGTHRVVIGSRQWYHLLATARVLINNNNFPHYFRKRVGQYYLQTWHGTPLKRLVFDVDRSNFSLSYWALMAREASYWDHLLAQNEYSAEILAQAFRYEGPVITEGYPRNDSLFGSDAQRRRAEVRDLLGVTEDAKVALYAPTWRDNAKSSRTQYAMVTYLDFGAFEKQLGKEWTLLLRGHHNIAAGRQTAELGVIDVTDYPEINDLYLAADVLINDYSSVMFDFAATGKPIVYLTPDISEYADSVRGFYFDLAAEAPGPLLMTTDDVVRALERLPMLEQRFRSRYRRFQSRFVAHDDGKATERVFGRLPISEHLGTRARTEPEQGSRVGRSSPGPGAGAL